MFSTLSRSNIVESHLTFANALNLDQSKNLSFGQGLNQQKLLIWTVSVSKKNPNTTESFLFHKILDGFDLENLY